MSELVFYEKPGCEGNRQQQAELRGQGVLMRVRDLLSEPWTPETLRPYFGEASVSDWFNQSAPAVRDGVLDIAGFGAEQALQALVADPILIRRPLLRLGELRQCGFVDGPVLSALGIVPDPHKDLQSCAMQPASGVCEGPQ